MKSKKYNFTKQQLEDSLFENAKAQSHLYKNMLFVNKIFGKTPLAEKVKRAISKKNTKDTQVYNMLLKEGYVSKYNMLCEYMDYRNEDEILFDTDDAMMEDNDWPVEDPDAVGEYDREMSNYEGGGFHLGKSIDDEFDDEDDDFMNKPYYDEREYTKDYFINDDYYNDYLDDDIEDDDYIDEMCEECGDKKKGYTHSDMIYEDDDEMEDEYEMNEKKRGGEGLFKDPKNMMPENWVIERNNKKLKLTFNKKLMSESLFKTKIERFEKMGYSVKAFHNKSLMESYMRK